MRLRIGAGILLLLATMGSSAQKPPHVTGFFSDMAYIPEAGDVLGTEVWIVYAGDHYYATVQIAEGWPEPPVVGPVTVSGRTVRFPAPEHAVDQDGTPVKDTTLNFVGPVTPTRLAGEVNSHKINLKRRSSYWQ